MKIVTPRQQVDLDVGRTARCRSMLEGGTVLLKLYSILLDIYGCRVTLYLQVLLSASQQDIPYLVWEHMAATRIGG